MLKLLKQEANMTFTENGAATYESTGSECLDLFATVGALRYSRGEEIATRFMRAYTEEPDTAMKLLFFARDIRGGLGERRVFRIALGWLAKNKADSVIKNLPYIAEYGRFDDLLTLFGTPCEEEMLAVVKGQFANDMAAMQKDGAVSLLAKWLPSVNASSPMTKAMGKKMAKALGLSESAYRKALTALRAKIRILENNLREKDYTFDYEKQPSRAMYKYRRAVYRNDGERYSAFLEAVSAGKSTLHADHVSPYELVDPYLNPCYLGGGECHMRNITPMEEKALNVTWASLPDFGSEENALAVVDTSGSMYIRSGLTPAAVALSLGLYFAEHNKGAFKNHFIEFSAHPQLIEIKGEAFADRLRYVASFSRIANTNLEAVFDLILQTAVKHGVPQEELPAKLVLLSDMEFDACVDDGSCVNFKKAKQKYEAHGYRLPQIVFWNVASRNRQQPVTVNEQGAVLVSGVTPRLFSMVAGELLSPYALMMETLGGERYQKITA